MAWDGGGIIYAEFAGNDSAVAGIQTTIAVGIFLVVLGAVLALDVRKISTRMLEGRWSEDKMRHRPNPVRIVGLFFLCGGVVGLVVRIYHLL